jgi:hypothetical protein
MIKIGEKAKGFRFDESSGIHWNPQMEEVVGKTGTVTGVRDKINELDITFDYYAHWTYPLDEYMANHREERLKELGI